MSYLGYNTSILDEKKKGNMKLKVYTNNRLSDNEKLANIKIEELKKTDKNFFEFWDWLKNFKNSCDDVFTNYIEPYEIKGGVPKLTPEEAKKVEDEKKW